MTGNEASEIHDIYGMWHVPFWQSPTFIMMIWALGILIALALLYFLVRYVVKRRKNIKPWKWAQIELDILWKQRGFTREDGKRFYSRLTDILKIYVEKNYGYQVRGATDLELLAYLREQNFASEPLNDLVSIFEGAQKIKFANLDAIPEQIERDFALGKAFIIKTVSDK